MATGHEIWVKSENFRVNRFEGLSGQKPNPTRLGFKKLQFYYSNLNIR